MIDQRVLAACDFIKQRCDHVQPRVGLILGSGLGSLADSIRTATRIPYHEIPGFPISRVHGHAGNLVLGFLGNTPVVAMQGRAHHYEGWSTDETTLPLRCMHLLGIRSLIVSNASGGIHSRFESGQVVLIDSHIDLMFRNPIAPGESASGSGLLGVPHRNGRQAYDSEWMDVAQQAGLRLGYALARGTYLATLGPNYETRAEYRFFAKIGADMVGMSTVPEVLLARQLGLRVLAFSIITNVAKPDAPSVTHHEEVLDWSRKAQDRLIPIIQTIIDKVGSTDATNNRPS